MGFEEGTIIAAAANDRLVELRARKREVEETLAKIVPLRSPPPHLYTEAAAEKFRASLRSAFMEGGAVAKKVDTDGLELPPRRLTRTPSTGS